MHTDMAQTTDTQSSRRRLLDMVAGKTNIVLLYPVSYLLLAMSADGITERGAGCIAMPSEDGALQSICDAIDGRKRLSGAGQPQSITDAYNEAAGNVMRHCFATWRHYGDDATDDEIAEAMAQRPCLVNYGGTLRAVNVQADGEAAIILKDMQA